MGLGDMDDGRAWMADLGVFGADLDFFEAGLGVFGAWVVDLRVDGRFAWVTDLRVGKFGAVVHLVMSFGFPMAEGGCDSSVWPSEAVVRGSRAIGRWSVISMVHYSDAAEANVKVGKGLGGEDAVGGVDAVNIEYLDVVGAFFG